MTSVMPVYNVSGQLCFIPCCLVLIQWTLAFYMQVLFKNAGNLLRLKKKACDRLEDLT